MKVKYGKYDPKAFQNAILACRNGYKISKAAQVFKVPYSTLHAKLKNNETGKI